jgi:hypothetical protein
MYTNLFCGEKLNLNVYKSVLWGEIYEELEALRISRIIRVI